MKLKSIGFFKELSHGLENGESLKEDISNNPQVNEDSIVKYLENGIIYCISPGLVYDVLDEKRGIIGSLSTLTDGKWIWPSDLSYYVRKYHVKLNEEFLLYMENNNWTIPNDHDIELEQLEL